VRCCDQGAHIATWLLAPALVSAALALSQRYDARLAGVCALAAAGACSSAGLPVRAAAACLAEGCCKHACVTTNRAGVSSPLTPILVAFQLLWAAAGIQLWRRQQALLDHAWHGSRAVLPPPAARHAPTRAQLPAAHAHAAAAAPAGHEAAATNARLPAHAERAASGAGALALPARALMTPLALGVREDFQGARVFFFFFAQVRREPGACWKRGGDVL
jgi:hypothetical protein